MRVQHSLRNGDDRITMQLAAPVRNVQDCGIFASTTIAGSL